MAHGHPPPHSENTQVLREAITEHGELMMMRKRDLVTLLNCLPKLLIIVTVSVL